MLRGLLEAPRKRKRVGESENDEELDVFEGYLEDEEETIEEAKPPTVFFPGVSQRNAKVYFDENGYRFVKHRAQEYRCDMRKLSSCTARIKVIDAEKNLCFYMNEAHNHLPNQEARKAQLARAELKKTFRDDPRRKKIREEIPKQREVLTDAEFHMMGTTHAISSMCYREKRKRMKGVDSNNPAEINLTDASLGKLIVLYDCWDLPIVKNPLYSIEMWNSNKRIKESLGRTNNAMESHNLQLQEFDLELKTLLSFGGRSFPPRLFQQMAASDYNRRIFVDSAVELVRQHGFDGIDVDWMFPSGDEDRQNLNALLKEFREAADAKSVAQSHLLLSAAVPARHSRVEHNYDAAEMAKHLDFVLLTSYDFQFDEVLAPWTGPNAPLFGAANQTDAEKALWNVNASAHFWSAQGMPKSKIVIGIPTYGRGWTLADPHGERSFGAPGHQSRPSKWIRAGGVAAYYELCEFVAEGAEYHFDAETQSSFLIAHRDQWYSFDAIEDVRNKLAWIRANEFGGAFVWTLDFDDFDAKCPNSTLGRYPITGTIALELGGIRLSQQLSIGQLLQLRECSAGGSGRRTLFEQAPAQLLSTVLLAVLAILAILACSFMPLITCCLLRLSHHRKGANRRRGFALHFGSYCLFQPAIGDDNELDCTLIDIEQLLYTGPNSRVYLARHHFAEQEWRPVAVKVPSTEMFRLHSIVAETRINAQLRHPRVVEYVGHYRDAFGGIRIVSEFMPGGNLHDFLTNRNNLVTVGHLFNFVEQIAEGMEYLLSKKIVHRDLAARNCMLNLECTEIKIADFGLSRVLSAADDSYACAMPLRLPQRWIAIECFDSDGELRQNCKFSEKTDVWAFGVVCWECFSRGAQPYGTEPFNNELLARLRGDDDSTGANAYGLGWRLARPEHCPRLLYERLLLQCWAANPQKRPTFSAVRQLLEETLCSIVNEAPDTISQKVT